MFVFKHRDLYALMCVSFVLRLNILHQANLDDKDWHGDSALHFAADKGNKSVATQLLQANAQPNALENGGSTALHYAADNGSEAVVGLLLEANADPKIVDKYGYTAAKHAEIHGHAALAKRLSEAEARL